MKPTSVPWRTKPTDATVMLRVCPPPGSTMYSSKLLEKLKTFGHLNEFKLGGNTHQPGKGPAAVFRASFASSGAAHRAIAASPFKVAAYHNLPSAKSLDPYDVLGLQQRKQPEAKTFDCDLRLVDNKEEEREGKKWSKSRILITDERSGLLYKGLLEAEAPMNLLDGLSSIIMIEDFAVRRVSSEKREVLKLDDLYRKGLVEDRTEEDQPPVRKYFTGGLAHRR